MIEVVYPPLKVPPMQGEEWDKMWSHYFASNEGLEGYYGTSGGEYPLVHRGNCAVVCWNINAEDLPVTVDLPYNFKDTMLQVGAVDNSIQAVIVSGNSVTIPDLGKDVYVTGILVRLG
jgi:hypothetical protein